MSGSTVGTKSLVDSIDELINLIENWEFMHHSSNCNSNSNAKSNNNNNNNNNKQKQKQNKKRKFVENDNDDTNILQNDTNPFDFGLFDKHSTKHVGKLPDGRHKKRTAANAMPDEIYFENNASSKRTRLIEQKENCLINLGEEAKKKFGKVMSDAISKVYNINLDVSEVNNLLISQIARPKSDKQGDYAIPCFRLKTILDSNPNEIAEKLSIEINNEISNNLGELYLSNPFIKVEALSGYINIFLKSSYMGNIVDLILGNNNNNNESDNNKSSSSYLNALPWDKERCHDIKRVMVEYSQPNTHKAFHVGHMRNVALGDCLVRLYKHCGYDVIAANYFGDEGAHVAKCLWLLQKKIDSGFNLDEMAPAEGKGEWLGGFYTEAVQKLSIKTYTLLPFKGVVSAIVLSKKAHPNDKAPKNWHVVEVDYGAGQQATVVCGGEGYDIGDYVAYVPIGGKFNGKDVIAKDMKGVTSSGVIMSAKELDINLDTFASELLRVSDPEKYEKEQKEKAEKEEKEKEAKAQAKAQAQAQANAKAKQQQENDKNDKKQSKKDKKNKNKNKNKSKQDNNVKKEVDKRIFILSKFYQNLKPGTSIIEIGRIPNTDIPSNEDILTVISNRDKEQRQALHGLENGDAKWVNLWQKTRQWCIDDFHKIYNWLDATFDHDFCESECSKPSRDLVDKYYKSGLFIEDNGAIGIKLNKDNNLGFCMLLKSDGTGLYATKDLALAQIKFEKYKIDKSIYVVDSAQSHHFKQVFATLEAMKYPQAKNCFHLAYAFVTLPEGRMASRQGRVVLFSELTKLLKEEFYAREKEREEERERRIAEANNQEHKPNCENKTNENNENDNVTTDGSGSKKVFRKIQLDDTPMTTEEKERCERLVSVGTIRYGMLNHDPNKEIVFNLKEWSDTHGNTGPYLMYQYTRVASIERNVERPNGNNIKCDFSLLNEKEEKQLLYELSEFQNRVLDACNNANPSIFCGYLYNIAQTFSKWYSNPKNNINNCDNDVLKVTRLDFAKAIANTLKKGLGLLGITVTDKM